MKKNSPQRSAESDNVGTSMNFKGLVELIQMTHDVLQKRAVAAVDRSLCIRNWLLGMYIVEFEQHGVDRAEYGAGLVQKLADVLKSRKLRGYSFRSLELFKKFYVTYRNILQTASAESPSLDVLPEQIVQTVSAQLQPSVPQRVAIPSALVHRLDEALVLSWSHYAFLVQIKDQGERRFYEIEAIQGAWSVSELKRQFDTSVYERLALSRDKDGIRELAAKGQVVERPADVVKNPYVLEFLDLDERTQYSESDLEAAIIDRIEHFLLELGKGFLFQSRQYRITFDDQHFWVDLVFYNRLLRCFVLVDLKIGNITHQDLGQLQMYVNYFDRKVKSPEENPTIGILLCRMKNDAVVEMTLPENNKTVFASRYQLYLPSKDELRAQVQSIGESGDE